MDGVGRLALPLASVWFLGGPFPLLRSTTKEITATGVGSGELGGPGQGPQRVGQGEDDWEAAGRTRTVTAFTEDQP